MQRRPGGEPGRGSLLGGLGGLVAVGGGLAFALAADWRVLGQGAAIPAVGGIIRPGLLAELDRC